MDWVASKAPSLTSEDDYPYHGKKSDFTCPASLPAFNQGARVTKSFKTYNGTEDLLRKLVLRHGAVLATLSANSDAFKKYKKGIFADCEPGKKVDHAITVVGYGVEKGKAYWLIKNSWGVKWGEKGYMRLKRGVEMCGIGKSFSAIECEKVSRCADDEEGCDNNNNDNEATSEEEEARPGQLDLFKPAKDFFNLFVPNFGK